MSEKINFKFRTTIRARILRLSIISIIVVAATLVLYNAINLRRIMLNDYIEQTQNDADIYADNVRQWVGFIKQQIKSEAGNEDFVDTALTIDQRKKNLSDAAALSEFKDFSIANSEGKTYNDTDISDRDYFKNAMNGETYISSPIVRKTDGSLTVMAGTQVDCDDFEGVFYGGLDVKYFSELIGSLNLGDSGEGFIIDNTGTLIACKDMSLVENQTNIIKKSTEDNHYQDWSKIIQKMMSGERGDETFTYVNGETYLVGFTPIDIDEGWSIGVMLPYHEVQLVYYGSISVGVLLTLILIFMAIFVDIFIADKIARPIREASLRIAKLSEGDIILNHRTVVKEVMRQNCCLIL